MKKKTTLFISRLALFLLAVWPLVAEVAVEEVVQAGRFVFYRDHADPHKYYYVPDQPRLATKRDGTPEFTFIKYTKTDSTSKGGVIHFLVTWGFTSGELNSAESALKSVDPQAKLAGPVPFKEGTFQIISATAGKDGIFNRRIVGEGKAPVLPGQKAAVSIALTEEGASLLWESFKNPTSDVSVQYVLKFSGITPAFQAKLKVDWDKVYTQHDIKTAVEGTVKVVKLRADLGATLEELRQKGAIQLEVVGENENMQKLLETAYNHILQLMCDKVPMETGGPSGQSAFLWLRNNQKLKYIWADSPGSWSQRSENYFCGLPDGEIQSRGPRVWTQQEQQVTPQEIGCSSADKKRAEQLYQKGLLLAGDKKYLEAIDQFKKAFAACPDPIYYYRVGLFYEKYVFDYDMAETHYKKFLQLAEEKNLYQDLRQGVVTKVSDIEKAREMFKQATALREQAKYLEASEEFLLCYGLIGNPRALIGAGYSFEDLGNAQEKNRRENYERAVELLESFLNTYRDTSPDANLDGYKQYVAGVLSELRAKIEGLPAAQPQEKSGQQVQQQAQTEGATATGAQQQATATAERSTSGAQTGDVRGALGQTATAQQTTSGQAASGTTSAQTASQTTSSSGQSGRPAPTATPATPEVKPIFNVQFGYSFKRTKLSGRYEVDMRRRLREDREIVMSGNISGIYQKYGEDKRFFTVVSLDDPAFQERTVEVILDGQDAEDFKNYVNSVSVIFRKQRMGGPVMTGEVKFFEQQFSERGNRLSFKYSRVNEASTEWLNYEYKTKWTLYGGVEWESDWVKTSDSVLTLTPPIRRRTIQISLDEDNILQNKVKAVAIQIKHSIYGRDITKELVIDYDKGDPLQMNYTYMHEEGRPGYSYRLIWLTMDGKEVETNWVNRESPFIFAMFSK
ncbi:MAG: tetratricopeptide repeat protein [Candidatus Saccharicenans sp.]